MKDKISEFSKNTHNGFASKLGFILAAAGSAVGLGNLWRFPYLAAQYGGGMFLLCYVILAVLFGVIMLMLEIAIGRNTRKGVIGAFAKLNKKFSWFGYFCIIVPIIILPYYCVIGGWVVKYLFSYIVGSKDLVGAGSVEITNFFGNFISGTWEPLIFFLIFALITILIVACGIQKGIEKMSKILMPALAIIAVALMVFVLFQPGALNGVKYFLVPNFSNFSFKTVLAALGQLFYSLSLAMCIMITYGAYMKKEDNITSSSVQIAVFDSLFAIVAGLIVIPAVFAFSSEPESVMQNNGASLMFIQLTNIFNSIPLGRVFGIVFFVLVLFAAITSSVSIAEAIVAVLCEDGKMKRITACCIVFSITIILGVLCSLGYGPLSFISIANKSILDAFDYLANNIMMPIVAIITCVFAGWFIDSKVIKNEICFENKKWLEKYFVIIVKYVAPICILLILLTGLFYNL